MKKVLVMLAVVVGFLLVRPEAASAQTCQICSGPVPMRYCVSTYQSGYNDCVSDGTSCQLNGGTCAGGHTFFSPEGSTRRVRFPVARATFLDAGGRSPLTRAQSVAGGFLVVDCKQRVIGRVQTAERAAEVRRVTRTISL